MEADKWGPLASIIKFAHADTRTDLIKILRGKSLSNELFSITQSFRSLSSGFDIISVYETKPTVHGNIVSLSNKLTIRLRNIISLISFGKVVLKESALMHLPNEDQIPRNADHRSVCTFASSTSDGYASIVGKIIELSQVRVEKPQGDHHGIAGIEHHI